jgi:hypothetical protein
MMILQKIKNMSSLFLTYHRTSLTIITYNIATSPQQKNQKKFNSDSSGRQKRFPAQNHGTLVGLSQGIMQLRFLFLQGQKLALFCRIWAKIEF